MRAILIVNPKATTTTASTRDILISTLRSTFELQIEVTAGQGHAQVLAEHAVDSGFDYVLTFGGDGTVNEVVNGLKAAKLEPSRLPILGPLPGGSANVFTRALGFSNNPVQAVGQLITGVNDNDLKVINLGCAKILVDSKSPPSENSRKKKSLGMPSQCYFTFSLGVGLDAEVIERMEALRMQGKRATPARYLGVTLNRLLQTDRHEPKLTVTTQAGKNIYGVFSLIVQNTTPWTFFGPIALSTTSEATFESGLDFLAIKQMGLLSTLGLAAKLTGRGGRGAESNWAGGVAEPLKSIAPSEVITNRWPRAFVHAHDQSCFTLQASQPLPMQIDGEFHSRVVELRVKSVPKSLAVVHNLGD